MALPPPFMINREFFEHLTSAQFQGSPITFLDAEGNPLLEGEPQLPDIPTISSTIADRAYEVGAASSTVDLLTKFDGATSFEISPTSVTGVALDKNILSMNPTAPVAETTISIWGVNAGGRSATPLTFKYTVNVAAPTVKAALPDIDMLVGDPSQTINLDNFFNNATSYTLAPTGAGISLNGKTLTVSGSTERAAASFTVTAKNSGPKSVSQTFTYEVAMPPIVGGDFTLELQSDGTVAIANAPTEGTINLKIEGHPKHDGTYAVNAADFAAGPVFLKDPSLSGNPVHGETLVGDVGLIVYSGSTLSLTEEWLRDGASFTTGPSYQVDQSADGGSELTYQVTADDGLGSRIKAAAPAAVVETGVAPDTFDVEAVTLLKDYKGGSGINWGLAPQGATPPTAGNNRFKVHPGGFIRSTYQGFQPREDIILPEDEGMFAEVWFVPPADGVATEALDGVGPAVCVTEVYKGYYAYFGGNRKVSIVRRDSNGSGTVTLWSSTATYPLAEAHHLRLEAVKIRDGEGIHTSNNFRLLLNEVLLKEVADSTYLTGKVGVGVISTNEQPFTLPQGISQFHGGAIKA